MDVIEHLHAIAHHLKEAGVDPATVRIRLPENDWEQLRAAVAGASKELVLSTSQEPSAELEVGGVSFLADRTEPDPALKALVP